MNNVQKRNGGERKEDKVMGRGDEEEKGRKMKEIETIFDICVGD